MLISSVITAAGQNSRMIKSQKLEKVQIKNKLLLPFSNSDNGKSIIETTIENTLSSDVDECIVVLGHFADEIREIISNISDSRLKIIENKNHNVNLSNSLLNGLKHCNHDHVLCLAGDQPTISSNTYKNIINSFFNLDNPETSVSILRRNNFKILNTAEGLGMPFMAYRNQLIKYLDGENDNINLILRKIFKDDFCFYGIKEANDLELININNWDDYTYVLNKLK